MPLYDYECNVCKNVFAVLTEWSQRKEGVVCTKCAGSEVRRVLSTFAVRVTSRWVPRSPAERLAGPGAVGSVAGEPLSILGHSH